MLFSWRASPSFLAFGTNKLIVLSQILFFPWRVSPSNGAFGIWYFGGIVFKKERCVFLEGFVLTWSFWDMLDMSMFWLLVKFRTFWFQNWFFHVICKWFYMVLWRVVQETYVIRLFKPHCGSNNYADKGTMSSFDSIN